MKTGPSN